MGERETRRKEQEGKEGRKEHTPPEEDRSLLWHTRIERKNLSPKRTRSGMTSPLNTLFLFLSLATFCFLSSHAVISFPKFPPPHLIQSAAEYTIQDLFHLEVWPREKAEWSQCLLGNCTQDHVTNIFLVDLIGGMDDPCFLAKNLDNRCFDQERAGDI